jgi:hypothetical protein
MEIRQTLAIAVVALGLGGHCTTHGAVVNFDVYPNGAAVEGAPQFTDQWASLGVIFSDGGSGGPGPSGNSCSISEPNHAAAGGLIVATFVDPCGGEPSTTDAVTIYQDWCWVSGEGIDVIAYDELGNEIGHQFAAGGGSSVSFSFKSPIIARLDIYHIGQGIDNFTFNPTAPVMNDCPADIAGGGNVVDVDDLLGVINNWGECGLGICNADITCNGAVDVDDLLAVINAWGSCDE